MAENKKPTKVKATPIGGAGITTECDGSDGNSSGDSGPRRPPRNRSMSVIGAEAAANGLTYEDFKAAQARAEAAFKKAGGKGAPTVVPAAAAAVTSLSPLSSSSSSQVVGVASALANRASRTSDGGDDSKLSLAVSSAAVGNSHPHHSSRRHSSRHYSSRHRRRSPSSDSSSSSDDERVPSLYYRGARIRGDEQYAVDMTARMTATHPTFSDWANEHKCASARNRNEQELVAVLIDLLQQVPPNVAVANELLCRRLAGIMKADESGDWTFANAINLHRSADLISSKLLRRAHSDISKQRAALASATSNTAANASSTSSDGRGSGSGGKGKSNYKGRGGNKSAAPAK